MRTATIVLLCASVSVPLAAWGQRGAGTRASARRNRQVQETLRMSRPALLPASSISGPLAPAQIPRRVTGAGVSRPVALSSAHPDAILQTFVVTSAADTGTASLRSAIHQANLAAGPSVITFDIGSGQQTIQPKTPYEVIVKQVLIDGTTQPGYFGQPLIELDGTLLANQTFDIGLELDAAGCTVRGLAVNRFAGGIVIDAGGDTLQSNYIGTDVSGTNALPNFVVGIQLFGPRNLIGGTAQGAGNVISGNARNIEDDESASSGYGGTLVQGNLIGTNASGTALLSNAASAPSQAGIFLFEATDDTIGGTTSASRNVIAGSTDGIYIGNNPGPSRTVIQGNLIGTDVSGSHLLGNTRAGITVWAKNNNLIGGPALGATNVISGNSMMGIQIRAGASGNVIQDNYVGADISGTSAIPNLDGIVLKGAVGDTVGGAVAGARNVVSGNTRRGIVIDTLSRNVVVQGNFVGVSPHNLTDLSYLGNGDAGITVDRAPSNVIGGTTALAGNIISANHQAGIYITGDSAQHNEIMGNEIGTDGLAQFSYANGANGITIDASNNTIGGALDIYRNYIKFNVGAGIYLASGQGNLISHNAIASNDFGIDIAPAGPNLNDTLDTDGGPNGGQNFPVLDSLTRGQSSTTIYGRLNSAPQHTFTIEIFQSTFADPSGYGQGETLIGTASVATDIGGNGRFSVTLPAVVDQSKVITATATDSAGNTSEFSHSLTSIKILRPIAGELWLSRDQDTIRWVSSNTLVKQVNIAYSLDSGMTFTSIAAGIPASQGYYWWIVPRGAMSKRSRIAIADAADPATADTSAAFRIKGLFLTRDSSGEYVRYYPTRHGWPFSNSNDAIMWPAAWYNQFNYQTGIDPSTGIFYPDIVNIFGRSADFPSLPSFVETFGKSQFFLSTIASLYNPVGLRLWLHQKDSFGGACYGLAVSSFMAFEDAPDFLGYFSDVGSFVDLSGLGMTDVRRRAIDRLFSSQWGSVQLQFRVDSWTTSPVTTLVELRTMLKNETRDDQSLTLINLNPSGAHQVNAYEIDNDPTNTSQQLVRVYDNNAPGDTTRVVTVNTAQNTWTYNGFTGWGGSLGFELGPPVSAYQSYPLLSSTQPAGAPVALGAQSVPGMVTIYNSSDASIAVTDSAGHTTGYVNGGVTNDIPGAIPDIPLVGGVHPPIGYGLPAGGNYSVVMTNFSGTTSHLGFFSDSTVFSYIRQGAQPGETDAFRVGTGFDYSNRDAGTKNPYMEALIVRPADEMALGLWNSSVRGNDSLHFDVVNRQNLHVINSGDSLAYDLHVEHVSTGEGITFSHGGLSLPSHSAAQIVAPWGRMQNTPVKILIDRGITGNYTDSLFVFNQTSGWNTDSSVNTAVCLAPGWQTAPMIVKDGAGGSIVIWQDQRKGTDVSYTDFDIYAQRLNAQGWPMWTVNGAVAVEDTANDLNPRVVPDGHGGAIVVWWTQAELVAFPYTIRAQHIDSTGVTRWTPGGLVLDTYANNTPEFYSVTGDGHGGVIVATANYPPAPGDVFAQRVDSSGALRWGTHGVPLAPGPASAQANVIAAGDGTGGGVFVWSDNRYGGTDSAGALFMQRVDPSGNILWGQGGVKLNNHSARDLNILAHGPGDYVVTWSLNPRQTGPQVNMVMAQRVDANGNVRWQANGVPVTTTPAGSQIIDDIVDDRRGGAILSWEEGRPGGEAVLAERLDSTGTRQWLATGIPLVTGGPAYYRLAQMVENGHGGALVVWEDYRNATVDQTNVDIYGQGIGADGSLAFRTNGIPVSVAPSAQQYSNYYKRGIALTDTLGTAVVAWEDARDNQAKGDPGQIYASRLIYPYTVVTGIGAAPSTAPGGFRLDQNYPNPFNPTTTIGYRLAAWEHVALGVYNILGQRVATLVDEDQPPGEHKVQFNGTGLASGVYFYRLHAGNFVQTRKFVMVK